MIIFAQILLLGHCFSNGCHSQIKQDFEIKPKPYEAQNTNFSYSERSSLISLTAFERFDFENQTHPVGLENHEKFPCQLPVWVSMAKGQSQEQLTKTFIVHVFEKRTVTKIGEAHPPPPFTTP